MGTKNRNRRIADFFLLYHHPFRVFVFLILQQVVPRCRQKNTTTKTTFLFPKSVVQGCPSLSSKNHDNIDNKDNISFLFQKVLSKFVPRCRQKKSRQHKQQRQHFFLIPKVLSKVVPRCRQKVTTT